MILKLSLSDFQTPVVPHVAFFAGKFVVRKPMSRASCTSISVSVDREYLRIPRAPNTIHQEEIECRSLKDTSTFETRSGLKYGTALGEF